MKASLQLAISQQLKLTPQLQQSIRLLQLSTLDLCHEIQLQLESNPMLDTISEESISSEKSCLPESVYEFQFNGKTRTAQYDEKINYEHLQSQTINLQDHLREQLEFTSMTTLERAIGLILIDSINDDGLLTTSIEMLQSIFNSKTHPLTLEKIQTVQQKIMHFDPVGCCAENLSETLTAQLTYFNAPASMLELVKQLIVNHLPSIGQQQYDAILKQYKIDRATLEQAIHIIRQLNPKPGSMIQSNVSDYIIPDLMAKKINHRWKVFLISNHIPRLTIDRRYAALIHQTKRSPDHEYLRKHLQDARWLIKSIESRHDTLLKVAQYLVDYQHAFMDRGDEFMKPLTLSQVAFDLEMHESTISRATAQKYLLTPRGMLELKYFFSSYVSTMTGETCSSTVIMAHIKKLISAEDRKNPLSDQKIAALLKTQGICVARRTIAKYRESLGLPASYERKTTSCQ